VRAPAAAIAIDCNDAASRIGAHVRETPLTQSATLGAATGATVFLKLDNLQHTGAFKLRGAANKLLKLPRERASRGVVAASAGNHALAVATVGRKLGIPVEIFVSEHLHPRKRARIEALGAIVNAVQGDSLAAELAAVREAQSSGRPNVSPYNDPDVIEGQGTIAVEVLRQLADQEAARFDAMFVAVGGGGLVSGIGLHLERNSPRTEVVGCWPANSDVMSRCMEAGEIRDFPHSDTWSTSTAGGVEPGAITLELCRRVIDRSVTVTEDEILDAARRVRREEGHLIEGAAAVAVAAFLKTAADYAGKTVVILLCGGNANPDFEALVTQPA
jgi:threonine dehydratase